VGGDTGAVGIPGGGVSGGGTADACGLGLGGLGLPPLDGTDVVEVPGGVVVVVGSTAEEPDWSSLRTSWCSTTGAGRSVTSAATIEVAVHTMAVNATVTASQSPVAKDRGSRTFPGCAFRSRPGLMEP